MTSEVSLTFTPEDITDQMVDDILSAAFYGGIDYWATLAVNTEPTEEAIAARPWEYDSPTYSGYLTRGGILTIIEDAGTEDEKHHTLGLMAMKVGILKAAIEWAKVTPESFYDDHDATGADIAVQYAVLGKIVYG